MGLRRESRGIESPGTWCGDTLEIGAIDPNSRPPGRGTWMETLGEGRVGVRSGRMGSALDTQRRLGICRAARRGDPNLTYVLWVSCVITQLDA